MTIMMKRHSRDFIICSAILPHGMVKVHRNVTFFMITSLIVQSLCFQEWDSAVGGARKALLVIAQSGELVFLQIKRFVFHIKISKGHTNNQAKMTMEREIIGVHNKSVTQVVFLILIDHFCGTTCCNSIFFSNLINKALKINQRDCTESAIGFLYLSPKDNWWHCNQNQFPKVLILLIEEKMKRE